MMPGGAWLAPPGIELPGGPADLVREPGDEGPPVRGDGAGSAGDELVAHPDRAVRGHGGRVVTPAGHAGNRGAERVVAGKAVLRQHARARDVDRSDRTAEG